MQLSPWEILPSQDFLKEDTVRYIFACIHKGKLDKLPPTPIVRKDGEGNFVAIDGHNLIAVKLFRRESIEVFIADSPHKGLPETSVENAERNRELARKYEAALEERRQAVAEGIATFDDLIAKYRAVFDEASVA